MSYHVRRRAPSVSRTVEKEEKIEKVYKKRVGKSDIIAGEEVAEKKAPVGYHYMPDGTLMLDSEMKASGGGVKDIVKDDVQNPRPITIKNSILSEEDFQGQTPVPVYLKNNTIMNLEYEVEDIPKLDVNNINSLISLIQANIWNKQKFFPNATTTGKGIYTTELDYFLSKIGGTKQFKISGDFGVRYAFVIKDTTNNKWYSWDLENFTNGYSEFEGVTGELITVEMPPVAANTTYEVYVTTGGILAEGMPTKELPWVINQLIDITTTINFNNEDSDHFTPGSNLVITAQPQTKLNSNGARDVSISVTRVSSELYEFSAGRKDAYGTGEHNTSVGAFDILPPSSGLLPKIIATDLVASINALGTVASITGTITIGESTMESVSLLFQPSSFFAIQ